MLKFTVILGKRKIQMSGHSKWNNIKRKKEKADGAKAKVFTKIGRELAVAVKGGGADPKSNSKLRDCILKAKSNNIPNENIQRILKKAAEDGQSSNYETITYEGYGPGGVAILVQCLTDNRNRTAGDLRHFFSKCKGELGAPGCVGFLFKEEGNILILDDGSFKEEQITADILELGAEDLIHNEENEYKIITEPKDLEEIRNQLERKNYKILSAEKKMVPKNFIVLDENKDSEKLENLYKLLDMLEDSDDVQDVFTNCKNLI